MRKVDSVLLIAGIQYPDKSKRKRAAKLSIVLAWLLMTSAIRFITRQYTDKETLLATSDDLDQVDR